jgi:hypothetical protein
LLFSPSFSRALCPHPLRLQPLPNGDPAGEPCFHPPLASRSDTFLRPMRPLSLVGPWRTTGPAHDPVSETFQSSFFVGLEVPAAGSKQDGARIHNIANVGGRGVDYNCAEQEEARRSQATTPSEARLSDSDSTTARRSTRDPATSTGHCLFRGRRHDRHLATRGQSALLL